MVSFKDQNTAYTYEVGSTPDATFQTAENNDASLGEFFSRPVKIEEFAWSTSIPDFYESFNPWTAFFENPRVINRVSNFNNLRCKLHVRFLINGNGFHFGRLLVNYKPIPSTDRFLKDRGLSRLDNVAASQRPHIFLDPTTSQGGDMILPFFWPENYLSIPKQEWRTMGDISIRTLQDLKHANGASDVVRISVFAWAEDVTLSIPTSSEPGGLVPQAGEDEYGKGPISRPASAVARVMGKLTNVPFIGRYARATEIAADATGAVATVFGYSRPNNLSDIQPYRPSVMGNLANVNVPDSAQKLSLDCKQELTVDPSTVGLSDVDEMTLCSIACRESWLTSFTWSPDSSVNPAEAGLFRINVTPLVWANQNFGGQDENHMPACCFAVLPFENWRGTMKYRFQIVASNYHKGRLKIVYDPHGFSTNEYNTNYTHVVDIAEEKDFTVEIGWGTSLPFCGVAAPGAGGWATERFANDTVTTLPGGNANGVLHVYVVNDLTIPSTAAATEPIEVNVFVSAGDDLMVRNPSNHMDNYFWFPDPQSGEENVQMDKEDTAEPSKPMQEDVEITMMSNLPKEDATDHVFFGESVVSIRSLLKRYTRHSTWVHTGEDGYRLLTHTFNSFPFYMGYARNAITPVLGNTQDYNFGHNTFINYYTPAYKGFRGGLRWKLNPIINRSDTMACSTHNVARDSGVSAPYQTTATLMTGSEADVLRVLRTNALEMMGGGASTNDQTNPCLEIEIPFQERERFLNARQDDYTSSVGFAHPVNIKYQTVTNTLNTDINLLEKYVSVGEDFSLFFFVGAPVMYDFVAVPVI